ncbi:MAG: glycosyltransferase family 4 protein [Ferruginibacter sp.]
MKRILYLTFYFEPDLCAGSFRNTPLAKELAKKLEGEAIVDIITTSPNRYSTFDVTAPSYEGGKNYNIYRINIPEHKSGMIDQIKSFYAYYAEAKKLTKGKQYNLVFASSSRLFTAYLGYAIAKKRNIPLYLDIRDIFVDTIKDVLKNSFLRRSILPILKKIEQKTFGYASHINLISAGFKDYFKLYNKSSYTYFPNGIDGEFLNLPLSKPNSGIIKTVTYAGNIGEGQGLHIIIPEVALKLSGDYRFQIIGDGGAKEKLKNKLEELKVDNVDLIDPVDRKTLLEFYLKADFLFIHLNDYDAFKKVLPSKVFELGAFDKPIIAGVAGYAHNFIKENIENVILFLPGDISSMVNQLQNYKYTNIIRSDFIKKFKRQNINSNLADSIISYL